MNNQRLVRTTNDIGNFFKSEPDHDTAVEAADMVRAAVLKLR